MRVNNEHYRTIWLSPGAQTVEIIDQTLLPHEFSVKSLGTLDDVATAIKDMHVRGAPLIGVAAGYGMYLAALNAPSIKYEEYLLKAGKRLKETRPTAVDLAWAVDRQITAISKGQSLDEKIDNALYTAKAIAEEDVERCRRIGLNGLDLIEEISKRKNGAPVNIMTHCNAGWLATVDYGTALSPVYAAHDLGIPVQVWVSETRPRNQGANLTAWELLNHGVPHHILADNSAGHLMQKGKVDLCIVGADRVTYAGDAANKIGTYLKALAAEDNNIPFYVALPSSTFDWKIKDGKDIPIEERDSKEVKYVEGLYLDTVKRVLVAPIGSPAVNFGFDVTPAKYITGLITERGICDATEESIRKLFPDKK